MARPSTSSDPFLLLHGGPIFTGDLARPFVEALGVRGHQVVAAGSRAEVEATLGSGYERLHLEGRLAVPGFHDAHVHLLEGGRQLLGLDLRACPSEAAFAEALTSFAARRPHGEWILHGTWDHSRWPEARPPTRALLDRLLPYHPALLSRVDGHVAVANSAALSAAGIGEAVSDPPGGRFGRTAQGTLDGLVYDTALERFSGAVEEATTSHREQFLQAALAHARRLGLTSVQDNSHPHTLALLGQLRDQGRLSVRVCSWLPHTSLERFAAGPPVGEDSWLNCRTVKVFADGSGGARTALMREPYLDAEGTGLALASEESLVALYRRADQLGVRVACHAIGDAANARVLAAIQTAGAAPGRHRVEHLQWIAPEHIEQLRALGVTASVQPLHAVDDLLWAEAALGRERLERIGYPLRRLLDAGAQVAFGSDWFISSLDPRRTLHAACADVASAPMWFRRERIGLAEALRCFSLGSARAAGCSDRGLLAPGMLADITVFDGNLFERPPEAWLDIPIWGTWIGGERG